MAVKAFDEKDANHDESLSAAELGGWPGMKNEFKAIDKNADGKIDRAELERHIGEYAKGNVGVQSLTCFVNSGANQQPHCGFRAGTAVRRVPQASTWHDGPRWLLRAAAAGARIAGRWQMLKTILQVRLPIKLLFNVFSIATLLAVTGAFAESAAPITAKLVRVDKIWSKAPHSAFTDLVWWHDRFYCAFREGENHVGSQGKLRIISSADGTKWQSEASLKDPVYDLRDANLSIMPDGRLMAVGGAQIAEGKGRRTGTFASYSSDGATWTTPELILPPGRWMWGVTWHDGTAWGVSYGAPERHGINSLLTSKDGRKFETYVEDFFAKKEWPTEARIRFGKDGTAYCLQRVDGDPNFAWLGSASPPYREWKWSNLERYIGGPNLLQLPSGNWVAAGRLIENKKPRTALMYLDTTKGQVVPILDLPSGGDCSYPGLLWHEGRLWMSYYSSHEQRTSIYLAQIDITANEPQK